MRSDSQCLQHLASVANSSASLVMKPFVHHLRGMNGIQYSMSINIAISKVCNYKNLQNIEPVNLICSFPTHITKIELYLK